LDLSTTALKADYEKKPHPKNKPKNNQLEHITYKVY